MNILLNISNCN